MLARKRGILSGPRVCTFYPVPEYAHVQVSYQKKTNPNPIDSDSDATVILDNNNTSPVPAKIKTTGRNKNTNKKRKQKTFVTKTYVLRKGGLPRRVRNKRKKTISIQVFNVLITMGYLQGEEQPFQVKAP